MDFKVCCHEEICILGIPEFGRNLAAGHVTKIINSILILTANSMGTACGCCGWAQWTLHSSESFGLVVVASVSEKRFEFELRKSKSSKRSVLYGIPCFPGGLWARVRLKAQKLLGRIGLCSSLFTIRLKSGQTFGLHHLHLAFGNLYALLDIRFQHKLCQVVKLMK